MDQNGYILFSVQKKNPQTSGDHFQSIAKDRSQESKNGSIFHPSRNIVCSFSERD